MVLWPSRDLLQLNTELPVKTSRRLSYDITITSSKKGSFSFLAKAQALGSLEIKLTNQGAEFSRLIKYEIVGDPAFPNIVEVQPGGYSIISEGEILGKIDTTAGRKLNIQEQVLSDGSILVRVEGADLSEENITISSSNPNADFTMYNLTPSLIDGSISGIILKYSQLGGIPVRYCPSEIGTSVGTRKDYSIRTGQFSHMRFIKKKRIKQLYYTTKIKDVEVLIHSSGKADFLINETIDEDKMTASLNENNNIIKVLRFAIINQGALATSKIYLGGTGFFKSLFPEVGNPPALVLPGISGIFLNEQLINNWKVGLISPFHTLVHEHEHILQSENCRKVRKKSLVPTTEGLVLSESYSELAAFRAIRAKTDLFNNINEYLRLTSLHSEEPTKAFTKDIKYLKTAGLKVEESERYRNEAFFFMLGSTYEAFLDKLIKDSFDRGQKPSISYSLSSEEYLNGAKWFLKDLNSGKYKDFGYNAKEASFLIDDSLSITIKPYGIATIQINQALINEKKMAVWDYQTEVFRRFFRIETEKNDSLQVVAVDTTGAFATKSLFTSTSDTSKTTVYSITNPVTSFADPNSEKNGFIGIINNSPQEQTFTILNMDELCIQTEGQPTQRWNPTTRICVPCDGRPGLSWNDQTKQCERSE
jgi:hypothetical protein